MIVSSCLRRAVPALVLLLGIACSGPAFGSTSGLVVSSSDSSPSLSAAQADPLAPAAVPDKSAPAVTGPQPGMALSLALAPGVALHGAGHFYAGRPGTGAALVLAELGSLYLMYRGGMDVNGAVGGLDLTNFSNFRGDSGQLSRGVGLAAGGLVIFLASWFYDLAGAPIAAAEQAESRRQAAGNGPVVTPRVTDQGVEIVISRLF